MVGGPSEKVRSKIGLNHFHFRDFHHVIAYFQKSSQGLPNPDTLLSLSCPILAGMEDPPGPSGRPDHGGATIPQKGRGGSRVTHPKGLPPRSKAEREAERLARGRARSAACRERKRAADTGAEGRLEET